MVLVLLVAGLRLEGQPWWCACGGLSPWSGDIWSAHNSQHLFDPYSFSHLQHGLVFHALLHFLAPRVPLGHRLLLAVMLETGWELLENSPIIINRYRAVTISLGYTGDTILNSLGDVLSCTLGFLLAARLPAWASIGIFLGVELGMLAIYRDSLLVNILMLLAPSDAVRDWQRGG